MKPKIARRVLRKYQWRLARHALGIVSIAVSEKKLVNEAVRILIHENENQEERKEQSNEKPKNNL